MQISLPTSKASTALLKINGLNLMLPQADIRTLESASDVDISSPALGSVGWISYQQKRWPVYCLSDELALMQSVPSERHACVVLAIGAGYAGLLCDDIVVLKEFSGRRLDVPVAMRFSDTPVISLATYDQGVACVSNADRLTAFIKRLVSEV